MRGMDTSVSYCRPNEHAEKAWWMTIGLLIHQYFASKKSFWFCRSIVLCVLVDDDNATGCSGASASTGTLVTTNHLLLITFLAVWKAINNTHTKGKKISESPNASHVRIFRRKRASWYVAKKIIYLFSRLVQCWNWAQWRCLYARLRPGAEPVTIRFSNSNQNY